MKYYTKEWYALMQKQHYTSGLTVIPDKEYTDAEIKAFFDHDLQAEIENDRRIHDTPPSIDWAEELLTPERFRPDIFLFETEDGELFHPETPKIAREYLEKDFRRQIEQFESRGAFDPKDTIDCFTECYRGMVRHGWKGYPVWVRESVDKRLIALHRIPESVYNRLLEEEKANKKAFDQMMEAADALKEQNIPEEIRNLFRFHDANVLSIQKIGRDVEIILRDGGFIGGDTPYCRLIIKNVSRLEREKGLIIRTKQEEGGEYSSNVIYLYDELYRTENGYEVHMLLTGRKDLRYLTVVCEDVMLDGMETI